MARSSPTAPAQRTPPAAPSRSPATPPATAIRQRGQRPPHQRHRQREHRRRLPGARRNISGHRNTAIAPTALGLSTGTKNIAVGFNAGSSLTSGNNNIYVGNPGASNESQTIRIGTAQAQTFIGGIGTTNVNGATVEIDTTTGQLGIKNSSARYKQDIAPMGTRSEKVLELRPVTFAYKDDSKGTTHYGLIAEQVAAIYPELVTHTATGEVQTVRYQELIPMLLNELQRQRQAIKRQEQELAEVTVLRKELAELRALVGQGRETASLER
jgi:hypothetical protein